MARVFASIFAFALMFLSGCAPLVSVDIPDKSPVIREFTARDAIEVLGLPRMANAASLEAKFSGLRSYLVPQFAEALSLVRAGEAVSGGATAKGVTVFVIDDFSVFRFKDGRYHGDYVSALIKLIAPDATVLTCDAWKSDLGECLFEANRLAAQKKIHVVNMSLGIVGTYCEFVGQNFEGAEIIQLDRMPEAETSIYEPSYFMEPSQAEALEHWVLELRQKGVTVISSAGNDGYRRGAKAPGCWSSAAVGAVYDANFTRVDWKACTDENVNPDDRTCWSNYGQIFAPGARIDNVFEGGISFNGTSAAAPIASGVAALVIGTKGLKGDAVAEQLRSTSDVIP
ncbi:MAG: S8/S53 family peptidase, partial [Candidatus Bathyarchaeia archaeon]